MLELVEQAGLENRCTLTGTVGSNPTLSAICNFRFRKEAGRPRHRRGRRKKRPSRSDEMGRARKSAQICHEVVIRSLCVA